jgi:hypothetical protein
MSLDQLALDHSVLPPTWTPPAAPVRELVWTMDRATHDSVASVHGFTFRLTGDVNPIALAAALTDVLERHDALRLTTVMVNRRRRQQVEPVGAPLDLIDLRGVDPAQRLDRARAVLATVLERPFNLARPPFLRAVLLRLAERDRMLGLGMHHVLCDGTSTGRLLDDLFEAYRAATAATQVRLRFPDYEHRVPCDRHRIVAGGLGGPQGGASRAGLAGAANTPTTRVGRMDQRGEAPRPAGTTPGSGQDGGPSGPPSCSRSDRITAVAS